MSGFVGKERLIFDPANPTSNDQVASYLFDSAGNGLTSTANGSGKQALDVNLVTPLVVNTDTNGIYNSSTNPSPANVGLIASSRSSAALANQTLQLTGSGVSSDGVLSNIEALDTSAFMMGWNGTGWDRLKSTNGALNVNTSDADITPATQAITAADTGTTATVSGNQTFYTGTPTAGSTASFTLSSNETVMFETTGTWTGTLQTEISVDGGTNWLAHSIHLIGSPLFQATFTANFVGSLNVAAKTQVRVRATAAMTGTATIKVIESANPSSVYVANAIKLVDSASGSTIQATIKAGTAAAQTSDTAIVVAQSPNSPTPAGTNTIGKVAQDNTVQWVTSDLADGPVAPGAAASKSLLGGMIASSAAASATNGQQLALQSDLAGNLKVNLETSIPAGANLIGSVNQGTSPWIVAGDVADGATDVDNPLKVGTITEAGPLSALATGKRANMISDLYRRLYINGAANVAVNSQSVAVGTSAAVLVSSPLAGRMTVMIQNNTLNAIYVGPSGVTTSSGFKINAGATMSIDLGPNVSLYAIASVAAADVRVLEVA